MTSVGSVGIGLVEDTTAMEVDSVGQEDATYLERGMGAVGIGQQDENEVEQDIGAVLVLVFKPDKTVWASISNHFFKLCLSKYTVFEF